MKNYPKVLTIQDISCVGQCSLTVALPILSACGAETVILPTAVLSTHTAFPKGFTFRDLSEDIPLITKHWKEIGIAFDGIYTGYLGSIQEIEDVQRIFDTFRKEGAKTFVDPAMADNGVLYGGFDMTYANAMKPLCFHADVILPNLTEACLLTDMPYRETYDKAYITEILDKLKASGAKTIILTGIGYTPDTTGVIVAENGDVQHYVHKRLSRGSHGTGDVYASAFVGAYLQGINAFDSATIAANYTVKCIENTQDDPDHWYGVKFETALPELIKAIEPELITAFEMDEVFKILNGD
ncbi:MAG TPA: pyridoxamine kinase [Ruminococcus sp.]|nr:pyridoxamine kinase [Ruminococcus sp.]